MNRIVVRIAAALMLALAIAALVRPRGSCKTTGSVCI